MVVFRSVCIFNRFSTSGDLLLMMILSEIPVMVRDDSYIIKSGKVTLLPEWSEIAYR